MRKYSDGKINADHIYYMDVSYVDYMSFEANNKMMKHVMCYRDIFSNTL
jgi:hypothetical protein